MSLDATIWPTPRKLAIGYTLAIATLVINAVFTFWNLNTIRATWDTLSYRAETSCGAIPGRCFCRTFV